MIYRSILMKRQFLGYIAVVIVLILAIWLPRFYLINLNFSEEIIDNLKTSHQEQLKILIEMNKLLVTLSTLCFAAIAAILFNLYKCKSVPSGQKWRIICASLLAGLSIYFGYLSQETVIWMLDSMFFNLSNNIVGLPIRLQFLCFIASVFCLGDFLIRSIDSKEQKNEMEQNV